MNKAQKAAQVVVGSCLNIQSDETVLIVTTEDLADLARLVYEASLRRSRQTFLMEIAKTTVTAIPLPLAEFMKTVDVIIALTSPSFSHTDARRNACRAGARIASLPNISHAAFSRLADADFKQIARRSRKLADILSIGKNVRVWAPNGTDLRLSIDRRRGYADTGLIHQKGAFSNLPAGEASVAPQEGRCEGVLIADSLLGTAGGDGEKTKVIIKDGRAVRVSGGPEAKRLSRLLTEAGPASRVIAEFGIGTNEAAVLSGCTLEDEKVLGSIHIGLGNNVSFGGNNPCPLHIDLVVSNAGVEIDGKIILENASLYI